VQDGRRSLRAIPGGPADKATNPDTPDVKGESALRDEYQKKTKDFVTVRDFYGRMQSAENSGAGDLALIFSYMKILDPTSVVRESEFANAENTAGIPDKIVSLRNRILNGERLADAQRRGLLSQATALYNSSAKDLSRINEQYVDLSKAYKYEPGRIVTGVGNTAAVEKAPAKPDTAPKGPQPADQPAALDTGIKRVGSQSEWSALKPGTRYEAPDGTVRIKK
jgi:hypothetical protein